MLNYYSFRTHKEYLAAVKEGAKVELEVTGEATILSPQMAKEIEDDWRNEYEEGYSLALYGVRPIPGSYHLYEAYRII